MEKRNNHGKAIGVGVALFCFFVCNMQLKAQLAPCKVFTNGTVVQRNVKIPVWGTATVGDSIIGTFNSAVDTAVADANGKWKLFFPAMSAGGPYTMQLKGKTETKTITDVYIGDVWFCSGQSNMELAVSSANNATANIAAANDPLIRQCKVPKGLSNELSDVLDDSPWTPATSAYVGNFSAVAYYFAKELHKLNAYKDVPIGILNVSYGGSRIETFMSEAMLGYDETDVVLANGVAERQPTVAFNKMVNPLIGYAIKGFLWYQGESNADYMEDAIVYGEQFKTLITKWRNLWNMGDLPFIWVQLPNQGTPYAESTPQSWDTWPKLRAAQSRTLSLPNTGEVTTIDVGAVDIHPKDKESVGKRIALVVRKVGYGEDIVYNGPRYKSHTLLTGGKVQISFDNIGNGLMAKDTTGGNLRWFSIAGPDGVLQKADAVISGNTVIVSNASVTSPAIVRYAWEYNPVGVNFYNSTDSLPAAPFKFDVVNSGFKINSFTASATTIERGSFVTLQWQTSGNAITTLNGVEVDSLSAIKLMPMDTTTYTLKITNKADQSIVEYKDITINVINPKPTILLSTKTGNVSAPNEEITIIADAKAPGGGTVNRVEIYINGELLTKETEAPYETTWTPTELGTYKITGLVINGINDSTWAVPYNMYINNLTKVRYEAETATLTGKGSVVSNSAESKGKYMNLTEPFTLTFSNVHVDTAGQYQLDIRYQMTYALSKAQFLYINGTLYKEISFTGPDMTTWMDLSLSIPLKAGTNEIMLKNSWGWMSFDYIDILGAIATDIKSVNATSEITLNITNNLNSSASTIDYQLPKNGDVTLDIYDLSGNKITTLANGKQPEGIYSYPVGKQGLKSGMYIAKLTCNEYVTSKKFVISK